MAPPVFAHISDGAWRIDNGEIITGTGYGFDHDGKYCAVILLDASRASSGVKAG